ncbi:unnamed protein product [Periconia digitata]|uniref:N-acetyltransferase domain-containing protein n=1 Tax=Periconia digitata TaxID=1303443 RepID=A0A9W4XTA7_9PLEO|nr:unnamed protein product [Periconia digitata]
MATADSLQIREATKADTSPIQQLIETAFQADDSRPDWTTAVELNRSFRFPESQVESIMAEPQSTILMATNDSGALIGVVAVTKRPENVSRIAHLAIDQQYQRGGLGRVLLARAEQYCRETLGAKRIGLNAVSSRKPLIAWYERQGYQRTGDQLPFPVDILLELNLPTDLYFVEMEKIVED